jgi:hypothetical protein
MMPIDLPCGLGAFVAERHGLPLTEAERLIEHWVSHYKSSSARHSGVQLAAHLAGTGGSLPSFESSFGPSGV